MLIPVCFYMYVNLLTQIPNIRKMILCGLYAAIYFEMYKSFSGVSSWTHSAHVPFFPPPFSSPTGPHSSDSQSDWNSWDVNSSSQGATWLLHDDDTDT